MCSRVRLRCVRRLSARTDGRGRSPVPFWRRRRAVCAGLSLRRSIGLRAPVSGEDELSRLRRAVDLPRLIEVGYDPRAQLYRPHAEHPVFGYALCPVVHCTAAVERHALCEACWRRFEGFQGTVEEFALLPRARVHGPAQQPLCLVCRTAGHERPAWRCKGLCRSCDAQRKKRGLTVAEYVAGAEPRSSFGRCGRCGRLAAFGTPRLCEPCHRRWVAGGKPDLPGLRQPGCGVTATRRAKSICRRWASARGWRSCTRFKSSGWMVATPG